MDSNAIKADFLSFDGRLNRQRFWMRLLALWAVMFVLAIIAGFLGAFGGDNSMVAIVVGLVAFVVYIPVLIAAFSLNIRRCHDRNRSGWFLILSMLPLLNIWYFIEIGILPGTPGSNQYGDDPLGASEANAMSASAASAP